MNEWETCIDEWATRCREKDATIAALQARLMTLKHHAGLDCGDNSCLYAENKTGMRTNGGCRCSPKRMKDDLERSRKACDNLQAQLTQRTAELEAVSNFIGVKYDAESKTWVSGQAPYLSAGTTKQEACIAAIDALRLVCDTWETKYRDLQAELERVRADNKALDEWHAK